MAGFYSIFGVFDCFSKGKSDGELGSYALQNRGVGMRWFKTSGISYSLQVSAASESGHFAFWPRQPG